MPFIAGSLTNPITLQTTSRVIAVQAGSFTVGLTTDEFNSIQDQIGVQLESGNLSSYAVTSDAVGGLNRTKNLMALAVPNVHQLIFKQNLDFLSALPGGSIQSVANLRVNRLKAAWNAHLSNVASFMVDGQHKASDASHVVSTADATDLASCIALINALIAAIVAHGNQAGKHFSNDTGAGGTGATITTNPPVTLADCVTDANDLLTAMTTHMGNGIV